MRAGVTQSEAADSLDIGGGLEQPNGFSLAEVIVAILVLSLALVSIFELVRSGIAYRRDAEALAKSAEASALVKRALDATLSDKQSEYIEVATDQIAYNGVPLVRLVSQNSSAPRKITKLERFDLDGERGQVAQSFELRGAELKFSAQYSKGGRLTHIVVASAKTTKNGQTETMPLAVSYLHVTGPRPCVFDALSGVCTDRVQ